MARKKKAEKMGRIEKTEAPFDYGEYLMVGKVVHEYEPGTVYEKWKFLDWQGVVIEARNEEEAKDKVRAMFGGEQHG